MCWIDLIMKWELFDSLGHKRNTVDYCYRRQNVFSIQKLQQQVLRDFTRTILCYMKIINVFYIKKQIIASDYWKTEDNLLAWLKHTTWLDKQEVRGHSSEVLSFPAGLEISFPNSNHHTTRGERQEGEVLIKKKALSLENLFIAAGLRPPYSTQILVACYTPSWETLHVHGLETPFPHLEASAAQPGKLFLPLKQYKEELRGASLAWDKPRIVT